jgi:hypothetical protein
MEISDSNVLSPFFGNVTWWSSSISSIGNPSKVDGSVGIVQN